MISIKNTFVHLVEAGATSARRSSSLPRSFRLEAKDSSLPIQAKDLDTAELTELSEAVWKPQVRAPSSCAGWSTEAASSEEDDAELDSSHSASCPSPPPSPKSCEQHCQPLGEGCPSLAGELLLQPPQSAEQPVARQRLNSKAQAWKPSAAATQSPEALSAFLVRFSAVVSMAAMTIKQCFPDAEVEASEAQAGWSIVIKLCLADFQLCRDEVTTLASQALLQAARASTGVHVLGSMASPFMATPFGFNSILAAVTDENQACWDALACGFCHRGASCRWQHPACQRTVSVLVKIAEAA